MSTEEKIRARVEEFIAEHHKWALGLFSGDPEDPFKSLDHKAARAALRPAIERNFAPREVEAELGRTGFSWPPQHDPAVEQVASLKVKSGGKAQVCAVLSNDRGFFEYHLVAEGDRWLIAKITRQYSNPDVPPANQPDLSELAAWHPAPLVADDYPDGLELLFVGSLLARTPKGTRQAITEEAGEIESPCGFLACSDPGSWEFETFVFELEVPRGKHRVQMVLDQSSGRVAAARVVFSGKPAASRVCATRWGKRQPPRSEAERRDSHYIGTDTAELGLLDAATLIALTRRQRHALLGPLDKARRKRKDRAFARAALENDVHAVAISSGGGDGVYPAFWLLDSSGKPVQLIMDFGLLGNPVCSDLKLPLVLRGAELEVESSELKRLGAAVKFFEADDGLAVRVTGPALVSMKGLDSRGKVLFDSESMDSDMDEQEDEFYLLPKRVPKEFAGTLELRFFIKNRYELA
jgi:hypothetical protein